jgi:hypothetical protein
MTVVLASPISSKAKNRFCNLMSQDPVCVVEQVKGDKMFLRSANNRYHFWVNPSSDPHWSIDWCYWESVASVCGGCSATDSHSQQGFYWFSISIRYWFSINPPQLILNKPHLLDSQLVVATDSQLVISVAYHGCPESQADWKNTFSVTCFTLLTRISRDLGDSGFLSFWGVARSVRIGHHWHKRGNRVASPSQVPSAATDYGKPCWLDSGNVLPRQYPWPARWR